MTGQIKRTDLHPSIQGVFTEFEEGYTTTESSFESVISNPDNIKEGMIKLNAKGRTIVNSVYNGNFKNGTDGWASTSALLTAGSNKLNITGNGTGAYPQAQFNTTLPVGSLVFVRVKYKLITSPPSSYIGLSVQGTKGGSNSYVKNKPVEDTEYTLFNLVDTSSQSFAGNIRLTLYHQYDEAAESKDKVLQAYDVMCIDVSLHPDLQGLTAEEINERVPSYVDGVQGSNGLLIKSIGKNIIPNIEEWYQGSFHTTTGDHSNATTRIRTGKIRIKPSTKYSIKHNQGYKFVLYSYNRTGEYNLSNSFIEWQDASQGFLFESDETTNMISIGIRFDDNTTDIYPSELLNIKMQLEEGTEPTQYEPYQESSSFLTEGLYQLPNGVRDEIVDNRLIKRTCDDLVYSGKALETWHLMPNDNIVDTIAFYRMAPSYVALGKNDETCLLVRDSVIPPMPRNYVYDNDVEGIGISSSGAFALKIKRSRLSSQDVLGLKEWLQENPITLIYQLSEPKVKQLNLPINAYKDGHVMVEGWSNYKLKSNDIAQLDNSTLSEVDIARTPERFLKNVTTLTNEINPLEIRGKTQVPNKGPQVNNVNAIGSYYATSTGALVFIYPKNKYKLQDIKSVLEGTKIYYKLGSEYWVQPEWNVTYPITLLSQINDNSKAISKLNEITQEHSDILATHGIRLDAMQGIVESGENANGRYVRFADGTQICYANTGGISHTADTDTVTTVYFPASFTAWPRVLPQIASVTQSFEFTINKVIAVRVAYGQFSLRSNISRSQTCDFDYIAIGRWK